MPAALRAQHMKNAMTLLTWIKSQRREIGLSLIALGLIAAALTLTFAHVLRSGPDDIAGRYDIFRYYGPITFYLDYCLSQGELPLWNPLVYCGLPNAANPQAFVFYPLNLIRSLVLPKISPQTTQESLIAFIGLHLLFMGWCTYLLGRIHRLSFPGALVAALAWVCSALIVRRACEYHFLYTMAWLPLILILVKCAIDTPNVRAKFACCIGAGLLLGIAILGGFLQIVIYLAAVIGLYALLYRLLRPLHPAGEPWWLPRKLAIDGVAFSTIFLIAGLIGAALVLPVIELSGFSARQKGMPVPMYSDMMSWSWDRIYKSVVVFPGLKYEAETLRGPGIVALLLAVAGCFHPNRRLAALLGLLVLALIDCGFGPPLPVASLLDAVTPFSSSAYSRGFDFALLPLGLLAGLGVDALFTAGKRTRILMGFFLVVAAAATILPLRNWGLPHSYLPATLSVVFLPALAFVLMFAALWTPRSVQRLAPLLLLIFPTLLFSETWSWNRHYVPWMIAKDFKDAQPVLQEGHHFPKTNSRGTDPIANRALYSLKPVMNGVDPLHFADVRNLLSGTPRDKRSHRLVTEWEPTAENHRGNLLLKRFFWLTPHAEEGPLPGKQDTFPPTTTTFLSEVPPKGIDAPPIAHANLKSVSERATRVEIDGAEALLEKQRAANQRKVQFKIEIPQSLENASAGSAGALHSTLVIRYKSAITAQVDTRITNPETDERLWGKRHRVRSTRDKVDTLEVPLPDLSRASVEISIKAEGKGVLSLEDVFLMVDPADEDALISIASFTANQVTLDLAPLPGPRILTFLDAWYPGWHAYVDDEEVPILKADDVFKAILVPQGPHRVQFVFRPRSVVRGLGVSALGLILAAAALAGLALRRPRVSMAQPLP